MFFVVVFLLGIFGLCVGSFLNVVICRVPEEASLDGRSQCPSCKKPILWYDLFPVVSFIALGGRCRACKQTISYQYPLVELLTASMWIMIGWLLYPLTQEGITFPLLVTFGIHLIAWSVLHAAAWIDGKHYYLPDILIFPLLIACSVASFFRIDTTLQIQCLGALEGFILFYMIFIFAKGKGFGFGDVKLATILGFLLGSQFILWGLFAGVLLASLYATIRMLQGKKTMKDIIPLAPFLVSGAFIVFIFQTVLQDSFSLLF